MKVIFNKYNNKIIIFAPNDAVITFKDNDVVSVENPIFSYTFLDNTFLLNEDGVRGDESGVDEFISSGEYFYCNPNDYIIRDGQLLSGRLLKIEELRIVRNKLLEESDVLSFILWPDRWAGRTEGERVDWLNYRKALRDIFEDYLLDPSLDPSGIQWPDLPLDEPVVTEEVVTEEETVPPAV